MHFDNFIIAHCAGYIPDTVCNLMDLMGQDTEPHPADRPLKLGPHRPCGRHSVDLAGLDCPSSLDMDIAGPLVGSKKNVECESWLKYLKSRPKWTTKKKSPDGATTKLETRAKSPARRSSLSARRNPAMA